MIKNLNFLSINEDPQSIQNQLPKILDNSIKLMGDEINRLFMRLIINAWCKVNNYDMCCGVSSGNREWWMNLGRVNAHVTYQIGTRASLVCYGRVR